MDDAAVTAEPEQVQAEGFEDLVPKKVIQAGGARLTAFLALASGASITIAAKKAGLNRDHLSTIKSREGWAKHLEEIHRRKAENSLKATLNEAPERNRRALSRADRMGRVIDSALSQAESEGRSVDPKTLTALVSSLFTHHKVERSATGQELSERLQVASAGKQDTAVNVNVLNQPAPTMDMREVFGPAREVNAAGTVETGDEIAE